MRIENKKINSVVKTVKVFKNGQSYAVRIPKEFRSSTTVYEIEQDGDKIILTPQKKKTWDIFLKAVSTLPKDNNFSVPEDDDCPDNIFMGD